MKTTVSWIATIVLLMSSAAGVHAAVPLNQLLITFGSLSERETVIFVAKDYGIFNKYGLDVRAVHVRNGAVALSALANGEAQFYMGAATGSTLGAIANGMDAVFITSLIHTLEGTFVVNPAIKVPADLKGKNIGVTSLGGGIWMRSMLAFEHWGLEPQRDKITLRVIGDESLLAQAMPNKVIDGAYFNYTFAGVLERQGFRVLADLAKLNIPYQNTAFLAQRRFLNSAPDTVERLLRALSDTITFVLEPKNKSLVLQSMIKGLRLARSEDAVGGYERLGSMYQRRIFPNVDGIRSTIRFLGATNEKIRALKAEDLVDERFVKKLEQEGRF
ncbi:MAG TPA: ABC transporter substrate-binding protein [Candidatus Limnocylindrales bacterium]|nr:ABC transporter substrate-binding protein [Candidatus Limnocylindrales bacterium]